MAEVFEPGLSVLKPFRFKTSALSSETATDSAAWFLPTTKEAHDIDTTTKSSPGVWHSQKKADGDSFNANPIPMK